VGAERKAFALLTVIGAGSRRLGSGPARPAVFLLQEIREVTYRELLDAINEAKRLESVLDDARNSPKHRSKDAWERDKADALVRAAEDALYKEIGYVA
jgi:hypothetical protein